VLVAAVTGFAAPAIITIDVTASPPQVAPGSDVEIHADITNTGNGTATHVTFKLQAPTGVVVQEAESPNGSCVVTAAQAVCNLANLPSGGQATVDLRVTTPTTAGTLLFDQISVQVDENDNDNDENDGKTDTFFADGLSVALNADPDFTGGCYEDGAALATSGTLSGTNPVITRTSVVGGDGLCTPYVIQEVTSGDGCPPNANCKMPQYVDVLFPDPEDPVTIVVQTIVKVKTVYADGVLVPNCPRRGTITEGKCLVSIKSLPRGGSEFTVFVASDIRLKG
jgi:hypothetical protein